MPAMLPHTKFEMLSYLYTPEICNNALFNTKYQRYYYHNKFNSDMTLNTKRFQSDISAAVEIMDFIG